MFAVIGSVWASPLVHEGDATVAVSAAEALEARDWRSTPWSTLRAGGPEAFGGGEVSVVCDTGTFDVETTLKVFRGAVLYADADLDVRKRTVQEAMACAGATPEQLGRFGFLAGVAAADADGPEAAERWFRAARSWDGALVFDDAYPAELKPVFEGAPPPTETVPLDVFPAPVTIDGRAPAAVVPGLHVVHMGEVGFWVDVGTAGEAVVWPARAPAQLGVALEDRPTVTRVLAAGLGEGTAFGLVGGDALFLGTAGRVDWDVRRPGPVGPPEVVRRSPAPWVVAGLGVVAAGVGTGLAAEAWSVGSTEGTTEAKHDAARGRYRLGWGLVGGGLTLTAAGGVWLGVR